MQNLLFLVVVDAWVKEGGPSQMYTLFDLYMRIGQQRLEERDGI